MTTDVTEQERQAAGEPGRIHADAEEGLSRALAELGKELAEDRSGVAKLEVVTMPVYVLAELLGAQGFTVVRAEEEPQAEEDPRVSCDVCGALTRPKDSQPHLVLKAVDVCPVCYDTTSRLLRSLKEAMLKHQREVHSQLHQMVRDVRGGADEPVFYRGFE